MTALCTICLVAFVVATWSFRRRLCDTSHFRRQALAALCIALITLAAGALFVVARYYYASSWSVELHARPIVRRGDPAVLQLTWGPFPSWETSTVSMQFRALSIEIAGQSITPHLAGRIREVPNWATQNAFPGYQAIDLPPALLARLPDGPVPVKCLVEVVTRVRGSTRTRHVPLTASFTLVPATRETIHLTTRPSHQAPPVEIQATGSPGSTTQRDIGFVVFDNHPPIPAAGDLTMRYANVIISLGTFPSVDRFPIQYYSVHLPGDQPVPGYVAVTLTPNRAVAARTFDVDTIGGDPVTIERIPVAASPAH